MVRINLLPHREEKRRQRKAAFVRLLVLAGLIGLGLQIAYAGFIAAQIANQNQRNGFIKAENDKLDAQIKEIATLKQEIDGLKARQQAVEDLQSDRNQPVYLMDELVKQVPEGIYLRSLKQENQRVILAGYAQSNERVSELLRNLSNHSPWLERPDLIEIRSTAVGQGKDSKRVFDFTVNVGIKRPRDKDKEGAPDISAAGPKVAAVAASKKP
ncbi:fimbrial assembly protein [Oxalobacteraceae bacterium OM1]|nr:fimbrial assembly protein [Oxalobacteraceae bacterium OM1]